MGKITDAANAVGHGFKVVGGELFAPEIALGKLACTDKKSALAAFIVLAGLVTAGVLGRNFVMSHLKEFGLGAAGLHTVTYLGMKVSNHRKQKKHRIASEKIQQRTEDQVKANCNLGKHKKYARTMNQIFRRSDNPILASEVKEVRKATYMNQVLRKADNRILATEDKNVKALKKAQKEETKAKETKKAAEARKFEKEALRKAKVERRAARRDEKAQASLAQANRMIVKLNNPMLLSTY